MRLCLLIVAFIQCVPTLLSNSPPAHQFNRDVSNIRSCRVIVAEIVEKRCVHTKDDGVRCPRGPSNVCQGRRTCEDPEHKQLDQKCS